MTRFTTAFVLLAGLFAVAASTDRASAQQGVPFKWGAYNNGKGVYPEWQDDTDPNGVKWRVLKMAAGNLLYPENPPVIDVVLKVYREGTQSGSWEGTPHLEKQLDPKTLKYQGIPISAWPLAQNSPAPSPRFVPDSKVKIVWEVKTKVGGVDKIDVIELPETVANKK